jgi:molecular chaperone GrpE
MTDEKDPNDLRANGNGATPDAVPSPEETDLPGSGPETVQPGEAAAEEVRRLKEERDNLSDQLLRAIADFDNFRKRTQREMADVRVHTTIDTLRAFLPVLDGFERALAASGGTVEDMRKGVELIHKQMLDAARRIGMEAIDATGKPFDPHQHEAIEMVETSDHPDHHVIDELQRGYRLKDKLIRPSMVRVARNPD